MHIVVGDGAYDVPFLNKSNIYFGTDAQCAPLRCLHKFLYVGAAIGRPFGIKVTFISEREGRPLPYGFARYISFIHSRRGGFHIRPFGVSGAYGMLPYGETNVVRDVSRKFYNTPLREPRSSIKVFAKLFSKSGQHQNKKGLSRESP